MDNHPVIKQAFRIGMLWGYPDLLERLYGEVRSALIEEREKRRQSEKEEQRMEHGSNVPEVVNEDEDNTVSAPPQFTPPIPFDDGSGPAGMVQADSEVLPINIPPTSNGHLSTTATATTEVHEPTSGIQNPQSAIGEADSSPDEIEEIPGPSIPGANDEEMRVRRVISKPVGGI